MSATGYLLISGLLFALVHASVKLVPNLPPHELVFFRSVISCVLTLGALRMAKISPWGINKPMLVLRGLAGTGALLLYFYTLQNMPLASAVTIQYLHPIITVVLAGLFLREGASWKQWLLFGTSFLGVLIVQGFDTRVTGFEAMLGVTSAVCSATAYTLIRSLRHQDPALVVVFYLPFVSLIVVGPYTAFNWVQPQGYEWAIVLFMGVFTQLAQYLMTRAYQADTAANISNLNYLGIVYALVIGAQFFGEGVGLLSLIGMGVIITSALLSTWARRKPKPQV